MSNAAAGKALFQIALQLHIFQQKLPKLFFSKPVRVPVFVVAESKTVWMNFLTHNLLQCLTSILRSWPSSSRPSSLPASPQSLPALPSSRRHASLAERQRRHRVCGSCSQRASPVSPLLCRQSAFLISFRVARRCSTRS